MKAKVHFEIPEVVPVPPVKSNPMAAFNTPVPSVQPQPVKKPPSPELEPEILQLKDSKFVRVTAKDVKNQTLPAYLQLELDLNPLKEGENISADRDSSIRHTGKP